MKFRVAQTSILILLSIFCTQGNLCGQNNKQLVRLAKLVIDSTQLEDYKTLLRNEINTSKRIEPGVITLYAVFEKSSPTQLTILEIYRDSAAYESHLMTPHFLNYKTKTQDMVKSLELLECIPLIPEW